MSDMDAPIAPATAVSTHTAAALARVAVSAAQADLSRMVGRGCYVALPTLGATLHLRASDAMPPDWSDALVLAGPFGALELAQGARLLRALTGIDLSGEGDIDADAERWSCMQAAVLGRLGGTQFGDAERILSAQPTPDDARILRLTVQTGAHALHTYARAGATDWLRWLQRGAWTRRLLPLSRLLDLPLELAVPLATHTLPSHVCRALAPGDVLLPDTPYFGCAGEGRLRIGARHARVRFQAPGALLILALEGNMDSDQINMPSPREAGAEESAIAAVDSAAATDNMATATATAAGMGGGEPGTGAGAASENGGADGIVAADGADGADGMAAELAADELTPLDLLPLTLSFELGQLRLSLGELRTLAPGSVLSCEGGSPAAVAIVARGRRLGLGEAVEVAGRLAIRVVQWGAQ